MKNSRTTFFKATRLSVETRSFPSLFLNRFGFFSFNYMWEDHLPSMEQRDTGWK